MNKKEREALAELERIIQRSDKAVGLLSQASCAIENAQTDLESQLAIVKGEPEPVDTIMPKSAINDGKKSGSR